MRKYLIIFGLGLLCFSSIQLYWIYKNGGNAIFFIQKNFNSNQPLTVKLSLAKEEIFEQKIPINDNLPYGVAKHSFGKTELEIWRDGEEKITKILSFFTVKWIVITFNKEDIIINTYYIPPFLQ